MGEREEKNKKEVKTEVRSVRTKTLKKRTMWYLYTHYPCSYIQYLTHLTNWDTSWINEYKLGKNSVFSLL